MKYKKKPEGPKFYPTRPGQKVIIDYAHNHKDSLLLLKKSCGHIKFAVLSERPVHSDVAKWLMEEIKKRIPKLMEVRDPHIDIEDVRIEVYEALITIRIPWKIQERGWVYWPNAYLEKAIKGACKDVLRQQHKERELLGDPRHFPKTLKGFSFEPPRRDNPDIASSQELKSSPIAAMGDYGKIQSDSNEIQKIEFHDTIQCATSFTHEEKELAILIGIAGPMTVEQIATKLDCCEKTIQNRLKALKAKRIICEMYLKATRKLPPES